MRPRRGRDRAVGVGKRFSSPVFASIRPMFSPPKSQKNKLFFESEYIPYTECGPDRFLYGSHRSNFSVAISIRYTAVAPPASFSHTLPSTSQCCGPTIDCCVSSFVNSGGTFHVVNVSDFLSNRAMPF